MCLFNFWFYTLSYTFFFSCEYSLVQIKKEKEKKLDKLFTCW